MDLLNRSLIETSKTNRGKFDISSLQFRLILGILIVYAMGISSMTMWISMEMHNLHTTMQLQHNEVNPQSLVQESEKKLDKQAQTIPAEYSYEQKGLKKSIDSLKLAAFLNLGIIAIVSAVLVQCSLSPVKKTIQWMVDCTADRDLNPLHLINPPMEIEQLTQIWRQLFTQWTETKEQQRQFINDISHELRTPLSVVYGYLQRLLRRDTTLTPSQRETLELVASETEHLIDLLQSLLDVARVESCSIPFYGEAVLLDNLLPEVVAIVEKLEHQTIQVELDAMSISVRTNRNCLVQVLLRLVNYITSYSQLHQSITLTLSQIGDEAIIKIHDQGDGFVLPEQVHILNPSYRPGSPSTDIPKSAELGLAAVESLTQEIGGRVSVESHLNRGRVFILSLPTVKAKGETGSSPSYYFNA